MKVCGLEKYKGTLLWIVLLLSWGGAGCGHSREGVQHRFQEIDRWVEIFEAPERDQWQKPEEVIRMLKLKPGDAVADIGAGTGYFTRRIAQAVGPGGKALGLDIEPGMVKYMRKDAKSRGLENYRAHLVGPHDPQLSPASVDVVFICNTFHHLQERIAYLEKLVFALRPGGRVVVVDFYKWTLPMGPPPKGKLTQALVREEFQQAGYRLIRAEVFLPYQYFLEFEPLGTGSS